MSGASGWATKADASAIDERAPLVASFAAGVALWNYEGWALDSSASSHRRARRRLPVRCDRALRRVRR
jgi:hypothetical protein